MSPAISNAFTSQDMCSSALKFLTGKPTGNVMPNALRVFQDLLCSPEFRYY